MLRDADQAVARGILGAVTVTRVVETPPRARGSTPRGPRARIGLPAHPDTPTGEVGLFGPDSVTWRVHGDVSMGLGGLRALLLQALHPLAMAGVSQHSDFERDPWGRLARTGEYVATVTYGTRTEAERAGRIVRAVHAPLHGVEEESGTPYRVADPELLRWVHCAEVDSFLAGYRHCGGALTPGEQDAYVAEQVRAAELVGVDAATVPDSVAALQDYFREVRPQLRATAAARRALRFVLAPPMPTLVNLSIARPAWALVAVTAFGLLPRWAKRHYGPLGLVSALPGGGLGARVGGRSLSAALRLLPAAVAESPARRAALARVAAPDAVRAAAPG